MQLYKRLINLGFNIRYQDEKESKRMLIETQLKYFQQYKIHGKYFLLSMTMASCLKNNGNHEVISQIERARLVCLVTLPLMFDQDEELREHIEEMISQRQDLEQIIKHDNPEFYRLIKSVIVEEENLCISNNFEKYFAINGFLRNLMNEIIKLNS